LSRHAFFYLPLQPETDAQPSMQDYVVDIAAEGKMVLDAILLIKPRMKL